MALRFLHFYLDDLTNFKFNNKQRHKKLCVMSSNIYTCLFFYIFYVNKIKYLCVKEKKTVIH